MRPELGEYLLQTAQKLALELAETQANDYDGATLRIYALLNMIGAGEHDRGADLRAWENGQMRRLFARASVAIEDVDLAKKLRDATALQEASLRISDLNDTGDALRRVLIDLQAYLDGQVDPGLIALNRDSWTYLAEATKRRALTLMPMG